MESSSHDDSHHKPPRLHAALKAAAKGAPPESISSVRGCQVGPNSCGKALQCFKLFATRVILVCKLQQVATSSVSVVQVGPNSSGTALNLVLQIVSNKNHRLQAKVKAT